MICWWVWQWAQLWLVWWQWVHLWLVLQQLVGGSRFGGIPWVLGLMAAGFADLEAGRLLQCQVYHPNSDKPSSATDTTEFSAAKPCQT